MRRIVLLTLLLAAAGCGVKPRVAAVSGRITLDRQPLAGATVAFQPVGNLDQNPGPGSYAKTDAEGRYTLQLVSTDEPGAIVGTHRVRISTLGNQQVQMSDAGVKLPKDRVPRRYNSESTLTFEVPVEGTQGADFPLTTP